MDPDSMNNSQGLYGDPNSPVSILNPNGVYGSKVSPLSPLNELTTTPPIIVAPEN